jgi:hypothetical protein
VSATLAMIVATPNIPQRVKCPLFTAVGQTAHAVPDAPRRHSLPVDVNNGANMPGRGRRLPRSHCCFVIPE